MKVCREYIKLQYVVWFIQQLRISITLIALMAASYIGTVGYETECDLGQWLTLDSWTNQENKADIPWIDH